VHVFSAAFFVQGEDTELWWEASFEIPEGAVAVNFVVNCENAWDNNGGKDHKVIHLIIFLSFLCFW
jgi:hypothetical protein